MFGWLFSAAHAGSCVDAQADAIARLGAASEGRSEPADIDGDGQLDWFFAGGCGTGGCVREVYLARGSCGVWVGAVGYKTLSVTVDRGRTVLELSWELGCCSRIEGRARLSGDHLTSTERRCDLGDYGWECAPWRRTPRRRGH